MALVTGGAVRVGRAISLALAAAGYELAVHYRASEEPARSLARHLEAEGVQCHMVQGDLADAEAPDAIISSVEDAFGRLDLLVNSAALFDAGPLLDIDARSWDRVMAVNVRAPHLLVRAAAALLEAGEGGCVVNIVDLSAFQPWTGYPHHAVSKAALAHLTRVQARAMAPRVRVNAVAPGAVLPPEDYPEARVRALRDAAPLQALGSPEDVADAVVYLAGARFVTGHILVVDGGRLLGPSGPPGE